MCNIYGDMLYLSVITVIYCCRSPHGERGLKCRSKDSLPPRRACRSPHGERGLKYSIPSSPSSGLLSLPARGAWIEITLSNLSITQSAQSLPARGAWIEMYYVPYLCEVCHRRSPHGERGLKCRLFSIVNWLSFGRSPHGERGLKCS